MWSEYERELTWFWLVNFNESVLDKLKHWLQDYDDINHEHNWDLKVKTPIERR